MVTRVGFSSTVNTSFKCYNVTVFEMPKGGAVLCNLTMVTVNRVREIMVYTAPWRVKVNSGTLTEETGQTTMVQYSGASTDVLAWLDSV